MRPHASCFLFSDGLTSLHHSALAVAEYSRFGCQFSRRFFIREEFERRKRRQTCKKRPRQLAITVLETPVLHDLSEAASTGDFTGLATASFLLGLSRWLSSAPMEIFGTAGSLL
jgi:hypothetical protein